MILIRHSVIVNWMNTLGNALCIFKKITGLTFLIEKNVKWLPWSSRSFSTNRATGLVSCSFLFLSHLMNKIYLRLSAYLLASRHRTVDIHRHHTPLGAQPQAWTGSVQFTEPQSNPICPSHSGVPITMLVSETNIILVNTFNSLIPFIYNLGNMSILDFFKDMVGETQFHSDSVVQSCF